MSCLAHRSNRAWVHPAIYIRFIYEHIEARGSLKANLLKDDGMVDLSLGLYERVARTGQVLSESSSDPFSYEFSSEKPYMYILFSRNPFTYDDFAGIFPSDNPVC